MMATMKDVNELSAKVTALLMLVETLYTDDLSKHENPAKIADGIIARLTVSEKRAREATGDTEHAMLITEAITSLLDRAAARAVSRRAKKPPL